jgi:integration host factor subunit beta
MLKPELVKLISVRNPHLDQRDVEKIVNVLIDEIIAAMARGARVELRDFGVASESEGSSQSRASEGSSQCNPH